MLMPWFASPGIVLVMWLTAAVPSPDIAVPADKMEAYIKGLSQERRSKLVEDYAWAGLMFSSFLKFRKAPQIYLSCPKEGCDATSTAIINLETLQSYAPATLGRRASTADTSGIEVYLAPEPNEFSRRDRDIDARLRMDAHFSNKTIRNIDPRAFAYVVAAPCWSAIYFDKRTGVIEKSLIYIDSDAPSHLQGLCMAFELVRAVGVMSTPSTILYQKIEAPVANRHVPWLGANAYMHGLSAIEPGDKYERALSVLKNRFGLTESP